MDDNEARYLIGEYNKYVSWRVRLFEILFPYIAAAVAITALYFSYVSLADLWLRVVIISIIGIGCLVATALVIVVSHSNYREQLALLERHRFKYKSLPDSVTFEEIVKSEFRSKGLKKLLEESEKEIARHGRV